LLAVIAGLFFIPETSFSQAMVVSSYFNAADPRDEWTELIVIQDNLDVRNWTIGDNNATQDSWQTRITFRNDPFWQSLRAGTIIVLWHRPVNSAGVARPEDLDQSDGFIQIRMNNPLYFTGGDFGVAPAWNGTSMNVASTGDLIQLRDAASNHVQALGHRATPGSAFNGIPIPKLNHSETISDNEVVMVVPGNNIAQYGTSAPQNGTFWTARSAVNITQGLPNTSATYPNNNSVYWRSLRQASWPAPNPSFTVNAANTAVTLNWAPIPDPVTTDGTVGYMIVRNTVDVFSDPLDGYRYLAGDLIGSAVVVNPSLAWSTTSTITDNIAVPCADGLYYRVYAFKYATDNINGNNYNVARGRAYNETEFAAIHVTIPSPVDLTSVTSDVNNLCDDNLPASITLTGNGGSGETLEWFTGTGCTGTPIGTGTPFVLSPAPGVTTIYSAHWKTTHCGNSACSEVTVTVDPAANASVGIVASANPVCAGTSVTYTATPVNGGTTPVYAWYVGAALQAGETASTFSYTPANGDQVYAVLTSSLPCATDVNSNTVTMTVDPILTPDVNITASQTSVCVGNQVTFTAAPTNGGTTPVYAWYVNTALQAGETLPTFTYTPANNDQVYATLTSSESCVTGNPATSNTVIITVNTALPVSVSIIADNTTVCAGTAVNFTATPVNGGATPGYAWYVNNIVQPGQTAVTFSYIPANNDQVYSTLSNSEACATGSPATSNTIVLTVNPTAAVSVSIVADQTSVCSGTTVNFTASPVNGGATPVYAWYVNTAVQTGQTAATFSYIPANGDQVYATLANSEACATGSPATSNTETITVTPTANVSVSLSSDQTSICAGSTVTFTANPTNGGATPQYVFYVNGTAQPVQASPVFTYAPANNDSFYVTLANNETCAVGSPATSNSITITVSTSLPVSVTAAADLNPICSGSPASYTATPTNGGASPVYAWYLNGVLQVGITGPTFVNNSPADNDQVYVMLTNNETCATGSPATSATVVLNVTGSLPVSVALASDLPAVCTGSPVVFTATPVNPGTAPVYEWYVNGVLQPLASGPGFNYSPTANIDVYVVLTSNESCATGNPASSSTVQVAVTSTLPVSVTATAAPGALCEGDNLTFTATPVNEGSSPGYQWYLNSTLVPGETNPTYTFVPDNGDQVYVTLTNNEACATGSPASSAVVPVTVSSPLTVSLTSTADNMNVCAGTSVVYNAVPQNGGTNPVFAWYVNSNVQTGSTGASFSYVPEEGDQVHAMVTSSETCVVSPDAVSADVVVDVVTGPAAAVTLSSNAGSVCQGEPVTFTAAPENEGVTPVYRWLVNGVADPSANGSAYSYVPADGDLVTLEMTSSENCATNNPAVADETVALSPCGFVMQVPNAFTPDDDLLNDDFKPVLGEILPSKYLLQVFNRWGEIVFETNNPDEGWDGTRLGNPAPRGAYIYKLEFEVPEYITNSIESPMRGFVMLLR